MILRDIPAAPDASELFLPDWKARSVEVRRGRPVRIACVRGALLVTVEGDPGDHVLAAGEEIVVARAGRAVVAALGPVRVRLQQV